MEEQLIDGFRPVSGTSAPTLPEALAALDPQARLEDYEEVPFDAPHVDFIWAPSRTAKAWPIAIETPVEAWSYAAYFLIPPRARRVRNALLRIRTRAVQGEPWVGVLTRDQKDFVHRSVIAEGPGVRETLFGNLSMRSVSRIVVQNGAQLGSSRITIESASLLIPIPTPGASSKENAFPAKVDLRSASPYPSKIVQLGRHRFIVHGLSESDVYFKLVHDDFEPEFQAFCQQYVDDDAICIDIGANIGLKTLYLSRHARNGRVIAVEAAPTIAKCLEANVAANAASNIDVVQAAVGDRSGSAFFSESSAYGHIASKGTPVPIATLADIVNRLSLPHLDFIKIDVEGFEYPILKSGYDIINDLRALVLLEFNSWCQIAYADINPKEYLGWLFDHFAYVGVLKTSENGYDLLEEVRKEQLLDVLHDNLVNNRCTTDLVVTNALERL